MFPALAPKTYSILIAEDLTLVLEALSALFAEQALYRVIALCSDGTAALRLIESEKPDIAVLDLNLRDPSALEIVLKLRKTDIQTRIVVLSTRNDRKTVLDALRLGTNALLLKSDPTTRLLEAFDQILRGGTYISQSFDIGKLFVSGKKPVSDNPLEDLSGREYEVFSLLVEGIRARDIAARLHLSTKTVDSYRASLMRKLHINNLAGLVKLAFQRGVA
jgi:DNA-binding NarL/FixJ family response regulator